MLEVAPSAEAKEVNNGNYRKMVVMGSMFKLTAFIPFHASILGIYSKNG